VDSLRQLLLFIALPLAAQPPNVAPILEAAQCRACHSENGVASTTRLLFPPEGTDLTRTLQPLAAADLLWRKPTNRLPHAGGERIKQGSPEDESLRRFTAWLNSLPTPTSTTLATVLPLPTALRRLTHSQYNNTVADLLQDRTRPANQFPPEDFINGFTNQAAGQNISPVMAEDYARAAAKLTRTAVRSGALAKLIPCDKSASACPEQFVRSFGELAFRRPLSAAEVTTFKKLLGPSFDAPLVVETMLQSPGFLFHTSPGPAARLSYLLWDTAPDPTLRSANLTTQADIETQARRLLADPRAKLALNQFLAEWLRFDRVKGALRERTLFPEFGAELIQSMLAETTHLFEDLVWNDKNFLNLFTARHSFVNTPLAQLYDLPPPPTEFAQIAFPANSKRAGILGHASFLTLTSKPSETAPTDRGLFVREHFLCQIVPPPPPGVSTTLPVLSEEKPLTNRDRLAAHLSDSSCAGCHRLVDPIGFGFEQFDAIGRYREKQIALIFPTTDKVKRNVRLDAVPTALPVNTEASILGVPNSAFSSPAEAGDILARTPACQRCIVKQFFRYALGRPETDADRPHLESIFQRFSKSGFRFRELVLATVTSQPFLEESHAH